MAKKKTFENIISNLLGEPVSNLCHAFYDQYVEANVKFRSRAGMKEVIIRRQLGKCCKWCADLAGIYTPENAPDDIYRRHDNCKCMVTYKDEEGYTDAWSKKEFKSQKEARKAREIEIKEEISKKTGKSIIPNPNIEAIISNLEKEAERWINSLSIEEKRSIKKYSYNPGDKKPNRFFERINRYLRTGAKGNSGLDYHINNITSGISKYKIEQDFTVYRRVDINPFTEMEEGDIFRGKQYFSTSVDPQKALKKDFLIEIKVKKGTCGAYIDTLSDFDQTELLLDKDVIYKVKSLYNDKAILEVIV